MHRCKRNVMSPREAEQSAGAWSDLCIKVRLDRDRSSRHVFSTTWGQVVVFLYPFAGHDERRRQL